MSIMNAMFAGSSALANMGNAMSVIGNNLSNANTVGYKGSSVTFEDILSQTIGVNAAQGSNQVGNGMRVGSVAQSFKQGAFEFTSTVTDVAIDGTGFFIVKDYAGNNQVSTYYTRAGDFKRALDGKLVTNTGFVVQGLTLDTEGDPISGAMTDIDLSGTKVPSQPTSTVNVSVNLDAEASIPTATYDPTDPDSYNFATSLRVYDSVGAGHNIEVQFVKTASNTWEWHAVVDSTDLEGAANKHGVNNLTAVDDTDLDGTTDFGTHVRTQLAGAVYTHGVMTFTSAGLLQNEGSVPMTFNWDNGVAPQEVIFNFGGAMGPTLGSTHLYDSSNDYRTYDTDSSSASYLEFTDSSLKDDVGLTGQDGTVQFAAGFATLKISQDGFPAGFLERLSVNPDGKIIGSFDNGQVRPLYQLILASFPNESGLDQIGSNLFVETFKSGSRIMGTPQAAGFGNINSNSLEQSNVDMSDEFVRMISIQRSFQANSRVVSVVDGMLEELVNMKR
ncbi:MAG: flagellar hook protein FlgE [Magnetococcales bacterium]|nr:flagellar hook protein FlgE [Magnetococcales bacterium]